MKKTTLKERYENRILQQKIIHFLLSEGAISQEAIAEQQELLAYLGKIDRVNLDLIDASSLKNKIDVYTKAIQDFAGGLATEKQQLKLSGNAAKAQNFVNMFRQSMPGLKRLLDGFFSPGFLERPENAGKKLSDLANMSRENLDSPLRGKFKESLGSKKLFELVKNHFDYQKRGFLKSAASKLMSALKNVADTSDDSKTISDGILNSTAKNVLAFIDEWNSAPLALPNVMPKPETDVSTDNLSGDDKSSPKPAPKGSSNKRELYPLEKTMSTDLDLKIKSGEQAAMKKLVDYLLQNNKLTPEQLEEAVKTGKLKLVINHNILRKII